MIRVLIDEDLDVRLRHYFGEGVIAETVMYRGWKGLKNGDLLRAIEGGQPVDVLVTADRNLPDQQQLSSRPFATLILVPRTKLLTDLLELMPEVRRELPRLAPGQVFEVHPPSQT